MSRLFTRAMIEGSWRTKYEEPIKSTSGVPAKDSPNVKLVTKKSPITLKEWELGNFTYLEKEVAWHLYSGMELTKIPWM